MSEPLPLPPSLEPWRDHLEATAAPCLLFNLEDAEDPALAGCRYGGHPLVPPGTEWPRSPAGPLHFVGQLDFAELAAVRGEALPELPRDGVLALFYDMQEQRWGIEPQDSAYWKLVWTPRSAEAVALPTPRELEEAGMAYDVPVRMVPRLGRSLPEARWHEVRAEDYLALRERLTGGEHAHQVGGHPWWIQYDARLERGSPGWEMLWQIGSDDPTGFMWGDMGNLYLLVRGEDLRAARFDRAWLTLQCG
jgi:uncharacterized protein YwqG